MHDVDISAATAVHRWARVAGGATAIVYEDGDVTYAQLSSRVHALAAAFTENGVRQGDRVAYLGYNSDTLLVTLLAAVHIGSVFVPINFRLTGAEVSFMLSDAGVHTIVVEDGHRELVDSIAHEIPVQRFVLVDISRVVPAADQPASRWQPLSTLTRRAARDLGPVPAGEHDKAVLLYSSGTTGRPKGVVLTHGNLWWNHLNVAAVVDVRPGDTTLAVAPLFHIGGLNAFTLGTLTSGGTVVIRREFDAQRCLDDLVAHRVCSMFAVPPMFAALARVPGFADADLSCLRAAVVAGAPVPPQLIREYAGHGIQLQQAWGMTETSPFGTYLPAYLTGLKAGSAGFAMPYTEIKLVDPASGADLTTPMERGEICVRGPNVTAGYWNNPAANSAAFDPAGWFHTGDVGCFDSDRAYYVVGRLTDMIIIAGENVYPAEVEAVLSAHSRVREVAVVGVPHRRLGEAVVAVVACDEEFRPSIEELREFGHAQLAKYKLPTDVRYTDALPRNASGKLDKAALRDLVVAEILES
jgi:fatty-acyl-CoA synthase